MEYWDHAMGPQERVELRTSAVQAVLSGERKRHVAQRLGITRQTLHNWIVKHRCGGAESLVAKSPGRARRQVLEPAQEAQVAEAIMLLSPSTVNRRFTRWTKQAVAGFIEQSFGVRLSTWQVDCHLRRLGFGSHKEVRRAFLNGQARGGMRGWSSPAPIEASPRL